MRKVKTNRFPQIPQPWTRLVAQINGDLAIVRDKNNRYWLVNARFKRVYPDQFESLDAAKREASSVSFVADPASATPEWEEVPL